MAAHDGRKLFARIGRSICPHQKASAFLGHRHNCAPEMVPKALLELLRLSHGEARFAAVRELARRRHNGAVSELLALVLREQYLPALWALGEIADPRALPVLDNLLEHGGTGNIA